MATASTAPPRPQPTPPAEIAPPAPPVKERTDLRVVAIKPGFYPDPGQIRQRRRKEGDVFTLRFLRHYSPETPDKAGWMVWYDEHVPAAPTEIPQSTVPNQIQDPSSIGREQAMMVEKAGEPKQRVAWTDGTKGPAGSQVPMEPVPHNPR